MLIKLGLLSVLCGSASLLPLFTSGVPAAAAPGTSASALAQDPAPPKKVAKPRIDHEMMRRLFGNDPAAPPAATASTPELIALGKALYHDATMSPTGSQSCATCHPLAKYGMDGQAAAAGPDGKPQERNTPTTWNAARQFAQFWDGRVASAEDAAAHGLGDEAALVAAVKKQAPLVEAFGKAFPSGGQVTLANAKTALGAFLRSLVTKSRWDDYLDGNVKALTNEELVGLKAFVDSACITCHLGRMLGGQMYQKVGLVKPYASQDTGRMQFTNSEADKFMFKVPTLVNCDKTAPYYHDGKIATLEEAVKNMGEIQLGLPVKPEQVSAIVTFLKATTGALPPEYAGNDAKPQDAKADAPK